MARVPRPTTKPVSVWPIHRLADAAEDRIRRVVFTALTDMRELVPLEDLAQAYKGNNPYPLWESAGWKAMRNTLYHRLRAVLETEVVRAAAYAFRVMPPVRKLDEEVVRATGAFDVINQRAVDWAARESAELVTQVDAETRKAIRSIIVRMARGELTVQSAARELRQIVGLTTQQANAVYNFRRKLEQRAGLLETVEAQRLALTEAQRALLAGKIVETQEQVEQLVARYERRVRRQRAEMIARTESMTAANRGQQEAWLAARDKGLLEPEVQQVWLVTKDDVVGLPKRLCDICRPMDGQTAALDQPFVHPDTREKYPGPPIHPNCRCAVALDLKPLEREDLSPEAQALADQITVEYLGRTE